MANTMTCRRTKFKDYVDQVARRKNTTKSRVRAKVEHPFRILKRIFGFDKVRYRGLAKNDNRLCACFALVNLYLHRNAWSSSGRSVSEGRRTAFRDNQSPNRASTSSVSCSKNADPSPRKLRPPGKSATCAELP